MWRNLRSASGGPMGKNPVEGENSPFASGLLKIAIDLLGLGLDPCVDELLRETGETLGGDRCFSAFLSSDLDRIYGVREWCSAAAEAGSAAPLAAHHHPVLADELAQGRILQINDPAALPPDAAATRQACEERGLRSLVLAPLLHHGRLNGWIGVETLSEAMTWTETQLGLLGQVADLIAAGHQQEQRCNELHRLALAGERAKETTDRASRTKNEFMANMSHEIRTPVNAIVGIAHLVLQSELSERQRDQLRKIRASSQTLLGIINSILDFSKIDAGRMAIGREGTKGAAQEGAKQPTGQGNIPGGRVLVVEDNILNQEVATELIGDIGLEVVIADNGREALDIITEQHFDLILMDVQMPVMDGFEATAEIRSLPGFEKLPIVAMTAHAMSGDRERCLEAGMDDYISKPIDTDRLFEVLHKWAHTPTPAKPVEGSRVDDQGDVLPTDLAGINIEAGLARVGGNQLLFRKLLLQFLHDYRDVIETIRTALELGHRESGLRLLHTLKGVAATIGAERVHGAARELEAAVTAGTADDHARLLSALDRSLSPVLGSLTAMESESPKPQTDAGDGKTAELEVPDLEPLLRELKILLDEGDPEAAELLASCASRLTGSTASAQIRVLEQHIENFDFDDALVAASELATALGIKIERSGT